MELGADAVLINTAIAISSDPVQLASAFNNAVKVGRTAYNIGLSEETIIANPTSSLTGFLNEKPQVQQ